MVIVCCAAILGMVDAPETETSRPTRLRFEVVDATPAEACAAFSRASGKTVLVAPRADGLSSRRVTLRIERPLTFWEAFDALAQALNATEDPNASGSDGNTASVLRLVTSGEGDPLPVCYHGPLRLNVVRVVRERALSFEEAADPDDDAADQDDEERFEVAIQIFAEPGRLVAPDGAVRLDRVVDDLDSNLIAPAAALNDDAGIPADDPEIGAPPKVEPGPGRPRGRLGVAQINLKLRAPTRPSTRIERLEGMLPVRVATWTGTPLKVDLASAEGKTFEIDQVTLAGLEFKTEARGAARFTLITFDYTPNSNTLDLDPASMSGDDDAPPRIPLDTIQNRLEFLDEHHVPLRWSVRNAQPAEEGSPTCRVTLAVDARGAAPARMLVHPLAEARLEV
ncbi:MAG: hypothetical protein KGM43_13855, partial [Planctomycetota bacterium]|nr:hypothetical protein [Planctomycetota bacterium]